MCCPLGSTGFMCGADPADDLSVDRGDYDYLDVPGRKLGSMVSKWDITYFLNGVYWGLQPIYYNHLLTSWDIQVYRVAHYLCWISRTVRSAGHETKIAWPTGHKLSWKQKGIFLVACKSISWKVENGSVPCTYSGHFLLKHA